MTPSRKVPFIPAAAAAPALALAFALGLAPPVLADGAVLRGAVAYRERVGLPPDAQIEVRLEEAPKKAGEPGTLVARMAYLAAGRQVPIPFDLAYDPAKIVPGRSYVLRTAIRSRGYLLFAAAHPAPPLGAGPSAEPFTLILKAAVHPPEPAAGLTGAVWKLKSLGGAAPLPGRGTAGIEFRRDEKGAGQVSAGAGCNRILGAWEEGPSGALRILPGPSSGMTCAPELAAQEAAFIGALVRTARHAIEGRVLTLFGADAAILATFEAELRPSR